MASNPFRILEEPLPGVMLIDVPLFSDGRGSFIKPFHSPYLLQLGITFEPVEQFFSTSHQGVLRGMHFQTGEHSHDKLVCCLAGRVLDVVVDVRPGSATFNQPYAVELSAADCKALLIPRGYAHGFLSMEDSSLMSYLTTTVHAPSHDRGVLWSSLDFEWPVENPNVSERDQLHPPITVDP
jgi:dTDP-4-dehydrorhamnose 3,5-epimerase